MGYVIVGVIGALLGGVVGVFTMALMVSSHNADYHIEENNKEAEAE